MRVSHCLGACNKTSRLALYTRMNICGTSSSSVMCRAMRATNGCTNSVAISQLETVATLQRVTLRSIRPFVKCAANRFRFCQANGQLNATTLHALRA